MDTSLNNLSLVDNTSTQNSLSQCLSCRGTGRSCRKCLAGYYDVEPCTCSLNDAKSTKLTKQKLHFRQSRFFVRLTIGIRVAMSTGRPVRAFTLTESNQAIENHLDYGKAVNKFFLSLRREYGVKMAFAWVEHCQGDKKRKNRHILVYDTDRLSAEFLEAQWQKYYMSKVTGLEMVWSPKGLAFYLAKYLNSDDKFIRARFSNNWIFPFWWQWSKIYQREHGHYPSVETITCVSMLVNQK